MPKSTFRHRIPDISWPGIDSIDKASGIKSFMDRKIAAVLSRPAPEVLRKPSIVALPNAVPVAVLASSPDILETASAKVTGA